jgi:hypothetical protein
MICPLLAQSGHELVHCTCLLLTNADTTARNCEVAAAHVARGQGDVAIEAIEVGLRLFFETIIEGLLAGSTTGSKISRSNGSFAPANAPQ